MDDVRAVMDAVGSERAALFGMSEGGPMSLLFAAPTRSGQPPLLYTARMPATPHSTWKANGTSAAR
jgi:hypothetical protein